jgi:F-type H+-transporting ATPase subunit b
MDILEILGKIGFDWQVALANLVNFLVIYWILKKYAFGPIAKIIDERKQKIEEGLSHAQRAETELQLAKDEHERIVTEARVEANAIVSTAKERGDQMIAHAGDKAREEADGIVATAKKQAKAAEVEAEKRFRMKAGNLVAQSVQKILREDIDPAKDKTLTSRAAQELTAS